MGEYPCAVKSYDLTHKILVEVTGISNEESEKKIHDIEIEAGYYVEKIKIGDDLISIYLFEKPTNNLRIESGDWVSFFGQ